MKHVLHSLVITGFSIFFVLIAVLPSMAETVVVQDKARIAELRKKAAEDQREMKEQLAFGKALRLFRDQKRDGKFDKAEQTIRPFVEAGEENVYVDFASLFVDRIRAGEVRDPETNEPYIDIAIDYFERASASSRNIGLEDIGDLYLDGIGVPQSMSKAKEYYLLAIEKNQYGANFALAQMYEHGVGVAKDLRKAFELYSLGMEQNHYYSRAAVARFFEHGIEVEKNLPKALALFKKNSWDKDVFRVSRKINDPELYEGELALNSEIQQRWRTADEKERVQLRRDGFFLATQPDREAEARKALAIIYTIAKEGDAHVQNGLAEYYVEGKYVDRDPEAAAYWFSRAAAQNSLSAVDGAIDLHSERFGGVYDPQLVSKYQQQRGGLVSDNTIALAERAESLRAFLQDPQTRAKDISVNEYFQVVNTLSLYYLEKPDPQISSIVMELLELGDAKGHQMATGYLLSYYKHGTIVERDLAKHHEILERSAERGDVGHMVMVGRNYADGEGVEKDHAKAREYYLRAHKLGHERPDTLLRFLDEPYDKPPGVEENSIEPEKTSDSKVSVRFDPDEYKSSIYAAGVLLFMILIGLFFRPS